MPKFQVSYVLKGDASNRREIVFEHPSIRVSSRDVARAIINHEFPAKGDSFATDSTLTAGQVLDNHGITLLRTPGVNDGADERIAAI
jgi:hypothetical protein